MSITPEQQQQKDLAIASDKINRTTQLVAASVGLQLALGKVSDVLITMQARGYVAGGRAEITDDDLLDSQFTAEELHRVIELFAELRKFSMGAEAKADEWGLINAKVAG